MSNSEFDRLMEDLRGDFGLAEEVRRLADDPDAAIRWAAAKEYQLTRQDAERLFRSCDGLSDDELDKVAGGAWNDPTPTGGGG